MAAFLAELCLSTTRRYYHVETKQAAWSSNAWCAPPKEPDRNAWKPTGGGRAMHVMGTMDVSQ
ncbi:hypothetical protein CCACVL1_06774 [Corchorus capsularis]|uniref:Uncharacterized protein n=1 Tax=Corchorus capsularis TaxID=210143 RepID=A0A1R3JD13_COCAP|nr:hypothetical protein CCACVL1_06774 [Corchorus capsularis]